MAQDLFSVWEVADLLGLHVRTVRNYVRDGRLKAVRIGKQYRIAREDLETLTGRPASAFEREPVRRSRHVEASSIVQVDAISPEDAERTVAALLIAKGATRVDSIYDSERGRLKLILIGDLAGAAELFRLIAALVEPRP